jgi:hypothetical protein
MTLLPARPLSEKQKKTRHKKSITEKKPRNEKTFPAPENDITDDKLIIFPSFF